MTFEGKFTASALASGVSVPSGEHFTTLIGAVHNASATFWSSGGTASAGIESMAEVGGTSALKSEINANSNALAIIEQFIASGGTATATVDITLTTDHPLVTLTSMIAPSPDWFVGVSGLSLRNTADDGWQPSLAVNLFPYDAGTEEGTEFSQSNSATSPQGTITSIKGTGKFSDEPIATLTFDLLAAPEITTTSPILVSEDETAVETLTASDDDTDAGDLIWSKTGGADSGKFSLTEGGVLTFSRGQGLRSARRRGRRRDLRGHGAGERRDRFGHRPSSLVTLLNVVGTHGDHRAGERRVPREQLVAGGDLHGVLGGGPGRH